MGWLASGQAGRQAGRQAGGRQTGKGGCVCGVGGIRYTWCGGVLVTESSSSCTVERLLLNDV